MPETKTQKEAGAFELAFLESIYKRDPDDPKVLGILATLYTELGMIDKGLALDEHHVELTPNDPSARYDYACSLSMASRVDEAYEQLEASMKLGFDDTVWMQRDPDLVAVRCDERWPDFLMKHSVAELEEDREETAG
jgi:cytochrome c-type biogenesis protein CcmH/NrfG